MAWQSKPVSTKIKNFVTNYLDFKNLQSRLGVTLTLLEAKLLITKTCIYNTIGIANRVTLLASIMLTVVLFFTLLSRHFSIKACLMALKE